MTVIVDRALKVVAVLILLYGGYALAHGDLPLFTGCLATAMVTWLSVHVARLADDVEAIGRQVWWLHVGRDEEAAGAERDVLQAERRVDRDAP